VFADARADPWTARAPGGQPGAAARARHLGARERAAEPRAPALRHQLAADRPASAVRAAGALGERAPVAAGLRAAWPGDDAAAPAPQRARAREHCPAARRATRAHQ